jgi:hypothetical protein
MPRNGAGVFSLPAGSLAVSNTTIESSKQVAYLNDLVSDANTARPLTAGGTGGTSQITGWDGLSAKGTDIASAGTINLTTATGPRVDITGTTTITAVTLAAGSIRIARATGIFQITASASLVVNKSTSVNYTTAVGDLLIFIADGSVVSVTSIGSGGTAATTSAAGIVELATTTEAFQASSSSLAVTPAGLANLYSLALNNAIQIADLQGVRLNMAGGIADAYDSETDVDTATSTGETYDATNDLYSPSSTAGTDQLPTMTSATTSGVTISCTNENASSTYASWKGADKDNATNFLNNSGNTAYVWKVDFGTAKTITDYTMRELSSGDYVGGARHPAAWTVDGSSNDSSWTTVDTVSGQTSVAAGNLKSFSVDTPGSYRYYRFSVAANGPGNLAGWAEVTMSTAGTINNMTLVSNAFTATAVPTVARIATFIDPQVSMTINTDFTAEVSRDNGTTWTAATLALVSNPVGTVEQYEGTVSISSQPSGSSMKYRLKTLNNKDIDVTGTVFQWS